MANYITPKLATAYTNPEKIDITPKLATAYTNPDEVTITPKIFATYTLEVNETGISDIFRQIFSSESSTADISRNVSATGAETANADIKRSIAVEEDTTNDISRNVLAVGEESATADIRRSVVNESMETASVDIQRKIVVAETGINDISLANVKQESSSADIRRIMPRNIVIPPKPASIPPVPSTDEQGNTVYTFPAENQQAGLTSINIRMNERNLTDEITFGMAGQDVSLRESFAGTYLDYPYSVFVESIQQQGIQLNATCKYDVDLLITRMIDYKENEYDAGEHLEYIARKTGLQLYQDFEGFELENNISGEIGTTFQSVIESLFSWTGNIPSRLVNVFIRNGKIYAIQRGRESNTVDVDSLNTSCKVTRPEYTKELMRVETIDTDFIRDYYLLGNPWFKMWNEWIVPLSVYDDVLNKGEEHELHNSANSYDDDGNITRKTTTNKDGSKTEIEYDYSSKNGRKYLSKETEKHYDEKGSLESTRVTEYEYQGIGQYTATRFEDEEYSGHAVGYGKTSNDLSDYQKRQDAQAIGHIQYGRTWSAENQAKYEQLWQRIKSLFPLKEDETAVRLIGFDDHLLDLADEYNALNLKTQETVTLTIYNYEHIITFDDRIQYNGNTYYLVSNDVYKDTRINNRQTISAVRWY